MSEIQNEVVISLENEKRVHKHKKSKKKSLVLFGIMHIY